MHQDIMKNKIPLDIIAGFKNSGKTSLINYLLQEVCPGQRISVFSSEFGTVSYTKKCQLHTVLGGCICCTAQTELISCIKKAISAESPDRMIIEMPGKGNIRDILQIFSFLPECCLGQLIYILDVRKFHAITSVMGSFFFQQIQNAPVILLNHWHEISEEEQISVREQIHSLNPTVLLLYDHQEIDLEMIQLFYSKNLHLPSAEKIRRKNIRIRYTHP